MFPIQTVLTAYTDDDSAITGLTVAVDGFFDELVFALAPGTGTGNAGNGTELEAAGASVETAGLTGTVEDEDSEDVVAVAVAAAVFTTGASTGIEPAPSDGGTAFKAGSPGTSGAAAAAPEDPWFSLTSVVRATLLGAQSSFWAVFPVVKQLDCADEATEEGTSAWRSIAVI